jgi:hypothetical protein
MDRKVLLVVIDALTSRVLLPALREGRLPNFSALIEAGQMDPGCSAIFPSITPAATASIVTGCYPGEHGVGGAYWYDVDADAIHYYGDDLWVIARRGFGTFFHDFVVELNHDCLRCETVYQRVERRGLRAACLNYLWFRGDVEHEVRTPLSLRILPGVSRREHVLGPTILCLGDFVHSRLELTGHTLSGPGGISRRYGFQDDTTAEMLIQLAQYGPMPNFTVAYFPDNDWKSHAVGPSQAVDALENVDRHLGRLAGMWGGMNEMLKELAVVITGDHSQCEMSDDAERAAVELHELLHDYNIVKAGQKWSDGDELMICPNLRAAQIYLRQNYWTERLHVVERLLSDPRVDHVMWRDDREGDEARHFHVATGDRGRLEFWAGPGGDAAAHDAYGATWTWRGDLRVVGAKVDAGGTLVYSDYPNALERIAMGFDESVSGDLWVTAKPGFELRLAETEVNLGGGSHGSLHADDSLVPLIVAGAPSGFRLPSNPRTVDVAPLCLSLLGVESGPAVGESRVAKKYHEAADHLAAAEAK